MGLNDEFNPLPTEEVDDDMSAATRAMEEWSGSARRRAKFRLLISVLLNILLFLYVLIGGVWSMAFARTCPADLEQPVWCKLSPSMNWGQTKSANH